MSQKIADIRMEYSKHSLDENDVNKDPIKQFDQWFEEALKAEVIEPSAMNLATVSKAGVPATRVVLLKGFDNNGFVFFTNYQSEKGRHIEENTAVALNFFWPELERQVNIQGTAVKISKEDSETYFQSRPKGSQIGAWSSPQSSVIKNRSILEQREKELTEKFKDQDVLPKPEQWGGYLITPFRMEFWQGRPSRLHDRIIYTEESNEWKINRLAP